MDSMGNFSSHRGTAAVRQVFPVSEVLQTGEDQTYLKLADGRGWVRGTQPGTRSGGTDQ